MEPGPTSEGYDDSIAIELKEVIADEVKSHVANALATILVTVEEAVEQLFRATTVTPQVVIRTVVYVAVDPVIFDQIMRDVL